MVIPVQVTEAEFNRAIELLYGEGRDPVSMDTEVAGVFPYQDRNGTTRAFHDTNTNRYFVIPFESVPHLKWWLR
jgi:hypothetical protein